MSAASLFPTAPSLWRCAMHGVYSMQTEAAGALQMTCPGCLREGETAFNVWREAWDLHRRWIGSGIPERYRNRAFGNFRTRPSNATAVAIVRRFAEEFAKHRALGVGLLLTGDVGCGKTHLSVAALTQIIRGGATGAFVTERDFFAGLKRGRTGKSIAVDVLASVECLVLDDIGAASGTLREASAIADLLSARYDDSLPTIVTTNVPDLALHIGDRAVDRFTESMLVAHLEGNSYRDRAAEDYELRRSALAIPTPPIDLEIERSTAGKRSSVQFVMGERVAERVR
jgi:DNA replication protein DnaC